MTADVQNKKGMWAYLESVGVLEKGNEEEIKKAKKEFKKIYIREYKRKEREAKMEFVVLLSKQKGELKTISEAAKGHKTSVSSFIKSSALAYCNKTFLVPDKEKVASFELALSDCRNEIIKLSKNKVLPIVEKIAAIEKRIEKMELSLDELFRYPKELP